MIAGTLFPSFREFVLSTVLERPISVQMFWQGWVRIKKMISLSLEVRLMDVWDFLKADANSLYLNRFCSKPILAG